MPDPKRLTAAAQCPGLVAMPHVEPEPGCGSVPIIARTRFPVSPFLSRIPEFEIPVTSTFTLPVSMKFALVTGAGSGIGQATALTLARAGWSVALAGRRADALQAVADAITGAGGHALAVPTDVTNPASVEATFAQVDEAFGRLDLLFNNAGVGAPGVPLEDITLEQWQTVVTTNITGVFLCAQAAIRRMKAQSPQGGRIINNGSISSHVPRPNSAPYTASKHAVSGLTKSISLDCRRFNIACGQIDIGNAVTDMSAGMDSGMPQADGSTRTEPRFDVQHVADTIAHMAGLPLEANIPFVTIMANQMPYIGRG